MLGSVGSDMLLSRKCFLLYVLGQQEDMQAQVASITPLGEWLHDYKKGETNSRMQLRQLCSIQLLVGST